MCESYIDNLVVFNDPDDDEYEDDDGNNTASYYLGDELSSNYWIFRAVAKGDVGSYMRLYYDTSRVDVIRMLAFTMTLNKEKNQLERRRNGRRY